LLRQLRQTFSNAADESHWLDRAFAFWLGLDLDPVSLVELCDSVVIAAQNEQHYRPIAALGLVLSVQRQRGETPNAEHLSTLRDGLQWMVGRPATFGGVPQSFFGDTIALLGLALGAECLEGDAIGHAVRTWLESFLSDSYQRRQIAEWEKAILAVVSVKLKAPTPLEMPTAVNAAEARVALICRGLRQPDSVHQQEADEIAVLRSMLNGVDEVPTVPQAALRLCAVQWIARSAPVALPGRATPDDVVQLLRGIPKSLECWTWETQPHTSKRGALARQWHIDHEYHVQNLLWVCLAPIFPDLEKEFYTPPIGPKHPRADLGISSLRLIVEAKFMRVSDRPQDIIEQIAADASYYRAEGSSWEHLVPFIWDDSRRSETHEGIRQGLAKIIGVWDTVIISRPGKM
jgi:hypothetical protein